MRLLPVLALTTVLVFPPGWTVALVWIAGRLNGRRVR